MQERENYLGKYDIGDNTVTLGNSQKVVQKTRKVLKRSKVRFISLDCISLLTSS